MPALEIVSLTFVTLGSALVLRFIWLDSLRFGDRGVSLGDPAQLTPRTTERIALQAEADRVRAETESLPRAA